MIGNPTPAEYATMLRQDFSTFAARCFYDLNPQAGLLMNWHIEVIAAKLAAVRAGQLRRLIINLPPRHLKSLMASIAFPAWCLGHDPSAQILCVSYAQDLADKLARDCRSIMMSPWCESASNREPRRIPTYPFDPRGESVLNGGPDRRRS